MQSTDAIRGLMIPLPTVFDGTGEVDEPLMRDLIQYYVDAGVHAIFALGSYGQGPAMRTDQRQRVAAIVIEEVRGRIPVVVHIGAVDPYTSIELGVHARQIGADAVGIVGPYYYNDHTPDELVLHFEMVDRAVQLPVFVYNNPAYQGYAITVELMQRLKAAVPRIFGAKLAMGTISQALEYIESIPGFSVFVLASGIMPGLLQGIRGTVSPPLTVVPELGVALIRAIDEGRHDDAYALQAQVTELNDTLLRLWKQFGRTPYTECFRALGFAVKQYPRWPTAPLPDAERQVALDVHRRSRELAATLGAAAGARR